MNASPGTTRDENGFPIYCRPDRPCAKCKQRGLSSGPIATRRTLKPSKRRNDDWQWETTRTVPGNTVMRPWRRSKSGGWSRS